MTRWENPVIEELDLNETAWTTKIGDQPDGMKENCDIMYES